MGSFTWQGLIALAASADAVAASAMWLLRLGKASGVAASSATATFSS